MFLVAKNVPELQRLLGGKASDIEKIRGSEISVTVTLFLALAHRVALIHGDTELQGRIVRLGFPSVQTAIQRLNPAQRQISPEPFGAPSFDLYRIGSRDDLLSPEWGLFYD